EPTEENIAIALAEEPETVQDIEEKGWTGFHLFPEGDERAGQPLLYDYAVKGMLAEAARTLKEYRPEGGGDRSVIRNLQDKVKRYVFVQPRRIALPPIESAPLERPLRAMTAQGPRVTVVRSDIIRAGGIIRFALLVLANGGISRPVLEDVFEYCNL